MKVVACERCFMDPYFANGFAMNDFGNRVIFAG